MYNLHSYLMYVYIYISGTVHNPPIFAVASASVWARMSAIRRSAACCSRATWTSCTHPRILRSCDIYIYTYIYIYIYIIYIYTCVCAYVYCVIVNIACISLSITFSKSSAKLRASENQPLHQGYVYVFFKPPAENHLVFQMFLDNTPRDMVIIKWLHQNKSGYECILMGHRIMIE